MTLLYTDNPLIKNVSLSRTILQTEMISPNDPPPGTISPHIAHESALVFARTAQKVSIVKEILVNRSEESAGLSRPTSQISKNLDFRKILNDILYICRICSEIEKDLKERCSLDALKEAVEQGQIEQEAKKEYIALYHGRRWKQILFEKGDRIGRLKEQIGAVDKEIEDFKLETDATIDKVKEEIEEATKANPQWETYERKLAEVRTENLQLQLQKQEEILTEKLMKLNTDLPMENKAHETIVYYLQKSCENLVQKQKCWKENFEREGQEMQKTISQWKNRIDEKLEELQILQDEQCGYEKVVEEYRIEQKKKEEEQRVEDMRWNASVVIQARWRGWLVRKALALASKKKTKKKSRTKSS